MNAGILPETPRGSQGTRPHSLDQWQRQEMEAAKSWGTGEGNVSEDLREQNPLGSPQSTQERLEFRALPTRLFPGDSPQKLSQLGVLGAHMDCPLWAPHGLIMNLKVETKTSRDKQ